MKVLNNKKELDFSKENPGHVLKSGSDRMEGEGGGGAQLRAERLSAAVF
jgi:hypothetical protein